jgi:hypothetical protein
MNWSFSESRAIRLISTGSVHQCSLHIVSTIRTQLCPSYDLMFSFFSAISAPSTGVYIQSFAEAFHTSLLQSTPPEGDDKVGESASTMHDNCARAEPELLERSRK